MSSAIASVRHRRLWAQFFSVSLQVGLAVGVGLWLVGALTQRGWERIVATVVQGFTVVLTFLAPLAGFLFWLTLAPFAPFWNFDLPMGAGVPDLSLVRTGTFVVGVVLLAELAARKRSLPPLGWTEVGMGIFLIGMLQATRMALKGMVPAMQTAFDAYVIPLSAYFFARIMVNNEQRLQQVLNVLLVVGAYVAFLALGESVGGKVWFYPWGRSMLYIGTLRRVTALFGNPVYHAMILTAVLPVAIYRLVRSRHWWESLGYFMYIAGVLLAIVFLYSRAGYLAAFLVMLVMAVRFPRWRRIFVVGVLAGALLMGVFWTRFTQTELYRYRLSYQGSLEARVRTTDVALQLWRESPWWGIGYPNYGPIALQRGYFVKYDDKWIPVPHNTFVGILAQAGVFALAGYVGMLLGMVRELTRRYGQLWREVEGRRAGLWRSTLGVGTHRDAVSGWAVVALAVLVGYITIISTIDADPAQYSNLIFYTLMGSILGFMAHTHWQTREGEG